MRGRLVMGSGLMSFGVSRVYARFDLMEIFFILSRGLSQNQDGAFFRFDTLVACLIDMR